jgi:hypothetical protein
MDTSEEIIITLPVKQATAQHIEQIQATLTKRNAQIEHLTERLREAQAGEIHQAKLAAEYKRGWQDACNHLMATTADLARELGKVRREAFDLYLQSERREI